MRNPILAALDVTDALTAAKLAAEIAPSVGGFKIGSELFSACGPEIVRRVRDLGAPVFLDLKFHDIPNTVSKAVSAAARLGVQMLTVHASGGFEMMQAAETAARKAGATGHTAAPLVLGVTVLTSMTSDTLRETGADPNPAKQVERLAQLAVSAGLRGLVCSPLEIVSLRQLLPEGIQLVTPGIRTGAEAGDDQKRTLMPAEAMRAGADWLVIGRPIYAADNPRSAADKILASLQ